MIQKKLLSKDAIVSNAIELIDRFREESMARQKNSTLGDSDMPTLEWAQGHADLYENSGGREGVTLPGTDLRCILLTHTGAKTGTVRKTPLMRVKHGDNYLLVGSLGGSPNNPVWVHNLRANPEVIVRDATEVFEMRVYEVDNVEERSRLWPVCIEAFSNYEEYQAGTERVIPVFVAEPV